MTIQDENTFSLPLHATTSDNYIYVSDHDEKKIIKLNWQGEVKGKYDCRSSPTGLTMSDDETVFYCLLEDNTIREITGQIAVEYIQGPEAVCWSAETCTWYISSNTFSPEDKFIKIYKFSS